MKKSAVIILLLIITLFISYLIFWPAKSDKEEVIFTVGIGESQEAFKKLTDGRFVKSEFIFNLVMTVRGAKFGEGGYYLAKNMSVWNIVSKIKSGPDLKWVKVLEGMRKEQIGEVLAKTFNWSDEELTKWNDIYTRMKLDYVEGVYFPDTYLIPVKESGLDIANRMIAHFNEKMGDLFNNFAEKNIKWTTGIKIASLIQREAGGKEDMPIISGVIWNRLDRGMALQIDATIQYAKGKVDDVWWSHVSPADLKIDSPYNDYLNKGLPPTPICNPGIDAINAALSPADTDCLFYLHDDNRQIHCAKTYEEHLENVQKYLQ